MTKSVFITATNTDAGKTYVSCLILKSLNEAGLTTNALKPIASGCVRNNSGELVNDDTLKLLQAINTNQHYSDVNPIAFEAAIAPHIAAQLSNNVISQQQYTQSLLKASQSITDFMLIEGAGGWLVPLNETNLIGDVVSELRIPVILIVDMKLGCLNHSLLTYRCMQQQGSRLVGWIANHRENSKNADENIATLKKYINAPLLGTVIKNAQRIEHFDVNTFYNRLPIWPV